MPSTSPIDVRILPNVDGTFLCFTYTGTLGDHVTLALGSEKDLHDAQTWIKTTLILHSIHPALHAPDMVQRDLMTTLDAYEHNAYKD